MTAVRERNHEGFQVQQPTQRLQTLRAFCGARAAPPREAHQRPLTVERLEAKPRTKAVRLPRGRTTVEIFEQLDGKASAERFALRGAAVYRQSGEIEGEIEAHDQGGAVERLPQPLVHEFPAREEQQLG